MYNISSMNYWPVFLKERPKKIVWITEERRTPFGELISSTDKAIKFYFVLLSYLHI